MFKAAVIGLGNIGFRLDLDPRRSNTWSHVSAYEKCRRTELAGAVEIDEGRIRSFRKIHKDVPVFKSVDELFRNLNIDIVSICTPTITHYPILKQVIRYPAKGIFCEKPIAHTIEDAKKMIRLCDRTGVKLGINHSRRWQSSYLRVAEMIRKDKIGNVKAVHAIYPGQIFNIGTHLFDAVRMVIQKDARAASGISNSIGSADPSISGWIEFEDNIACTIGAVDKREDLVFEIDIIGSEGRLRILENGAKIEWSVFRKSPRYSGYRESVSMPVKQPISNDWFTDAIENMCDAVSGRNVHIRCSGQDGLKALMISTALLKSAENNGNVMRTGETDA